ncbi:MAG: hypothetical protein KKA07_03145 [Bacteroidetes bacterium]|nr:hypothetical protein [Bacteroidota bacterium]MBU1718047.1 hypothetical protein [Bacteroidota bacterium]
MKIFFQGRKNGYNPLFPIPTPEEFYGFAGDTQTESAKNDAGFYGKFFYSLGFFRGGCIFTKFIFVCDTFRYRSLGNISISIYIDEGNKLPGKDVKFLLDELIGTYCNNYCPDYYFNEKQEDWPLFTPLADSYNKNLITHTSDSIAVTPGPKDPAFHYYQSDNELIEHFDEPFQEEYSGFRQIFFIDRKLQEKGNPLDVLKHSGTEVNPDLSNDYVYLQDFDLSKRVKITANGKPLTGRKGENQIRAKWRVDIEYLKEFYKPIRATGRISDTDSEIYKYLEKNGSNLKIRYDAFQPDPEIKIITCVITKKDGTQISDAEIQTDQRPWQSELNIKFKAEELGQEHKIVAKRGDNFISDIAKITPKAHPEDTISLVLREKKTVRISAKNQENGNPVGSFDVKLSPGGKVFRSVTNFIEFFDEDIGKPWVIKIEKPGFTSEPQECHPKQDSEIHFLLRKTQGPKTGYVGEIWTPDEEPIQKSFVHKIAEKKWLFIIVLILALAAWAFYKFFWKGGDQPQINPLTKWEIETYVEGDSLMPDKLDQFKAVWGGMEQGFITKSGGGIFGGEKTIDSARWKSEWKPADESIDRAITKRKLVNDKNFSELKNVRYSGAQLSFKNAILNIDSSRYAEVEEGLGDVSNLTLKQISEKINGILSPTEQIKVDTIQKSKKEDAQPGKKTEMPENKITPKEQPKPKEQKAATKGIDSEIRDYLKGSELAKDKLEEYKKANGVNQSLINSINLALEFWTLDGSGNGKSSKTYWNFNEKVKNDGNFTRSKLGAFLGKMCQEGVTPSYKEFDKKKGLK